MTSIYIDGANLYQRSKIRGGINYKKFKQRLIDKYQPSEIYMFLGYVKGKEPLYSQLIQRGYKLFFKETLNVHGTVKGNCDTELVVKAISDHYEQNENTVILITGDGDFSCLVDFFVERKCKIIICAPDKKSCSYLLKKRNIPIVRLSEIKGKIQ